MMRRRLLFMSRELVIMSYIRVKMTCLLQKFLLQPWLLLKTLKSLGILGRFSFFRKSIQSHSTTQKWTFPQTASFCFCSIYYIKQKNEHVTKLQVARLYHRVSGSVEYSLRYATHLRADGMIRLQGWCEHFSGERDGANGWFNPGIK